MPRVASTPPAGTPPPPRRKSGRWCGTGAPRALHQDVGQRGRGAGAEDPAGHTRRHHRRAAGERCRPRRPHRRGSRRPPIRGGRPADFLHSTALTFAFSAGVPVDDSDPWPEFIEMCLKSSVSFTPTLSIVQNRWHFAEHPDLLDDPELRTAFNAYNPGCAGRMGRSGAPGGGRRRSGVRGPQSRVPAVVGS